MRTLNFTRVWLLKTVEVMIGFVNSKLWNFRFICKVRSLSICGKRNKMENLSGNPYFEKYATKLKAFQKGSPEEFLARLANIRKNEKSSQSDEVNVRSFMKANAVKPTAASSSIKQKKLDDVMKVDLVLGKSTEEIIDIWTQFHIKPNKVSAVIPASTYAFISAHAKLFPMFLYPLPRSQGYEFVIGEFSGHHCHFTSLINYQAYKENAPELLSMVHYTELEADKGIVLMNGEFDSNMLTSEEARFLINILKIYYTSKPDSKKYQLLSTFTTNPNEFQYIDLIAETENISL